MAITTYTELQSAISNFGARVDLAARLPEHIALIEASLNDELRVLPMVVVNQSFSIAAEYVPVPTGLLEVRNFYLNTSPKTPMTLMGDDMITKLFGVSSSIPKFYSIAGGNFRFGPAPNGTYSATLRYYQAIPPLVSNSTNWLLASHPNVYLAGSMMWESMQVMDDAATQKWATVYKTVVDELKSSDARNKWGGSGMAVRSVGMVV